MFKINELVRWLGLTQFEILTNLIGIFIFTIILSLKISNYLINVDWFIIFSPLFCSDVFNCYFCIIVGIRMYMDSVQIKKKALHRLFWSLKFILLMVAFKYMLCVKLIGQNTALEYSEVFSPIFILLQLIAIRACQLPNNN